MTRPSFTSHTSNPPSPPIPPLSPAWGSSSQGSLWSDGGVERGCGGERRGVLRSVASHPFWERRQGLFDQLVELDAPLDLFDPDFLIQCRAATQGIDVYWDQSLLRYVRWWTLQPAGKRHRNRQRAFRTWLTKDIATHDWKRINGRTR